MLVFVFLIGLQLPARVSYPRDSNCLFRTYRIHWFWTGSHTVSGGLPQPIPEHSSVLMAFSRKICIESTYTEVQSLLTFKHLEGRQAGRQGQFSFSFQCLPGTQDLAGINKYWLGSCNRRGWEGGGGTMNSYPDAQKHLPCGTLGAWKEAGSGEQPGAHRAGRGACGLRPRRRP